MAVGDIVDIGGRAYVELGPVDSRGENPAATYAPMVMGLGSPSDPAWDGTSADPSITSLLKAIALNTAP